MIRNEDIDIMRREELQRMRVMKKNFAILSMYVFCICMHVLYVCVCARACVCMCVRVEMHVC